jgi:hypothetical protein
VIAVIAVLATVVILVLNPAELLKQSRDANRLSDMTTLTNAVSLYSTDQSSASMGSPNTVYVSIPDPAATTTAGTNCGTMGLPTLPSGYAYHCAEAAALRNVDGTGWIPLNFRSISSGSPIGNLPVDPTNSSSSRLYYTYTTNGTQFELTMAPESQKYQLGGANDVIVGDGAPLAATYAAGSNLTLEPLDYGDSSLIGYWPLDEGSGNVAYDDSGNNSTGSWSGLPAGTNGYYSQGHGTYPWAGSTNGGTPYASIPVPFGGTTALTSFTITSWLNPSAFFANWGGVIDWRNGSWPTMIDIESNGSSVYGSIRSVSGQSTSPGYTVATSTWYYVAYVHDNSAGTDCLYVNGSYVGCNSGALTPNNSAGTLTLGGNANVPLNGLIAGVRFYNHTLTAAQISALYKGGK